MENWRDPTSEDRLDDPDVDGIVQLRRYRKQKRIGTGAFSHVFQHVRYVHKGLTHTDSGIKFTSGTECAV